MDDRETLGRMRDVKQIERLVFRFTRAIDHRLPAKRRRLLCEIFTEDIEVNYVTGTWKGLQECLETFDRAVARFTWTHHAISNHEIEVCGDTASAEYVVTAAHGIEDGSVIYAGNRYYQRLVRDGEGWLISHHAAGDCGWQDAPSGSIQILKGPPAVAGA
jgi:hypothetical protein